MRIVFWGSPAFALPSLRALLEEGHDVVGVVTQPDRPAGRGRRLRPSAVKEVALEEDVPVLTPERPRGDAFLEDLRSLEPEVSVVVAYGHILRPEVLDLPGQGSINVHASLLPDLRGAAPVNWAIIRGFQTTGVTIMRMTEGMDAGPILLQHEEPIGERDTASSLTLRLSEVGAGALVEALALLELGVIEEREQDHDRASFAPKVDRETARIDWALSAEKVSRWIRGMDRIPGAWSPLGGEPVKLFSPEVLFSVDHGAPPGTVLIGDPDGEGLIVATDPGAVRIDVVQPAGKRRMDAGAWLRGSGPGEGDRFG